MRPLKMISALVIALGFLSLAASAPPCIISAAGIAPQDASVFQQKEPPADGIWVSSLDLGKLPSGTLRRPGGPGRRAGAPETPPTPPPPPKFLLGGAEYPNTLPLASDRDVAIDVKGQAVKFASMVGIDGGLEPGRGSVIFGVWIDGRKAAESGLMHGGDAPKMMSVDLTGARRLVLAVIDGNDGTGGDSANWGGALITMKPGASARPEILVPIAEPAPPIASSRSAAPTLNYPRITGATPGKPFMFLIPASGEEPLSFAAKNLPAGLTLDPKAGFITGSLRAAGRTDVEIAVTNPRGRATGTLTIVGGDDALALTPPLGWNSWNAWGNTVTAERVKASADGMVKSGLHRQGYTYINIDDVWEGGVEPDPATGRGRNVAAARDSNGEPTTNDRFPDMKGLVDDIHSLGLKAGLYSSPGPTTCQGLGASYQHEEQDARAYARWGFDYLKYDWCGYSRIAPNPTLEDRKKPYKLMGDILARMDRDIVFSICQYGAGNVWEWGREVGGHVWRMTGDIRDEWPSMSGIGFQQTGREQYAGPGGWNDTDMLVVGMVGWSQGSRPTNLTPDEQLTHMALWALQAAPLLIGADLSRIDEWTTDLLGNREMLAVNQDVLGRPAGRKTSDGWTEVWARPLADGTIAAGLFNRGPEPAAVTAKWADLGLTGEQEVRDIWRQRDLGTSSGEFSAVVPRHGVVFVKIGRPRAAGK
jgi:alpha-galactosidase